MFLPLLIMSLIIFPTSTWAISNGSFESGNFNDWQTIGITSVESSAFGSTPAEGHFQGLINTGSFSPSAVIPSAVETFLGVPTGFVGALSAFGPGINYGSAIKQTFSANAGDTLSFQGNFLTNDGMWNNQDPDYRDYAFMTITGPSFLYGERLFDTLGGAIAPFDPNPFLVSTSPFNLESGYQNFSMIIPSSGELTVGFGVVDHNFPGGASGLLLDQVSLIHSTPEPSTWVLFGSGLLGFAVWRRFQVTQG